MNLLTRVWDHRSMRMLKVSDEFCTKTSAAGIENAVSQAILAQKTPKNSGNHRVVTPNSRLLNFVRTSTCLKLIFFFLCWYHPILSQELRGVVLAPKITREVEEVKGFIALEGVDIPGGQNGLSQLNKKLGPRFIGLPIKESFILELKRQVTLYFRDEGYPLVIVEIPEQNITSGVLQLVVTQGKLGKVVVQGNRYFSSSLLESYIQQKPGELIDVHTLLNDVSWINHNPFRHADLFFTAGEKEGTTDVELVVKERFPLRVYAGGDNTGTSSTGNARWFTGFTWGNVFGFDHLLTYQFTMATNYENFWAHTLHYNAPLPWHHSLIIFGGFAHVHPHITDFRSSGNSSQISIRYDIPHQPMYENFFGDLSLGFDFKNTNNTLEFLATSEAPVISRPVNLTQLYAGYNLEKSWKVNEVSSNIELFWSPGQLVGDQSNRNFSELQPGAKNRYVYGRLAIADTWTWTYGFALRGQVRGQISSQNLLPSEQLGLGGYNTVRGYDEREVNFDEGICTNIELSFPPIRLLKRNRDELVFLGFFDYGTGRDVHFEATTQNWQHLIGVGPALRYKIFKYLSVRIDWGFRLHTTQFSRLGNKLHVGVIANY